MHSNKVILKGCKLRHSEKTGNKTGLCEIWTIEVGIGVKNNSSVHFKIVFFLHTLFCFLSPLCNFWLIIKHFPTKNMHFQQPLKSKIIGRETFKGQFLTMRFSNHESRLLSRLHTFAIIVILDLKIHQSMWIHWPFFPKTCNHCNIRFENTSKYVDTLTLFSKNLNQRSLTPRWPLTPCLLRSHVWLYPRIIVSKSHDNTSMYVDTVINFAKYHIHTTYYILRTYYVQNEWSHSLLLNSVQARQKSHF